jgi:hypothetical protein
MWLGTVLFPKVGRKREGHRCRLADSKIGWLVVGWTLRFAGVKSVVHDWAHTAGRSPPSLAAGVCATRQRADAPTAPADCLMPDLSSRPLLSQMRSPVSATLARLVLVRYHWYASSWCALWAL